MKLCDRYVFPGVPITHERNQIRSATSVGEGRLPAHLKCCVPCSSEEKDEGAHLGNDDNTMEMGDVGCPEK